MEMQGIKRAQRGVVYFFVGVCSLLPSMLCAKKNPIFNEQKQQMMTPDQVLQDLIEGNKRFYSNKAVKRRSLITMSQKASDQGQFPKAVILACMDSRSIPEVVFDQSIADIFTLRVAGNIVNDDMIASMEYATKYSGSRLIVIMGHTQCGAIKAACANKGSGYLEALVEALQPTVKKIRKQQNTKEIDCSNAATITNIALQNVRSMTKRVLKKSDTIRELVNQGKVKIVGALHDLATGVVTFEV